MKTNYKQRLPHIQPVGAAFFVTFSLYGCVPKTKLQELKEKYIAEIVKANQIIERHQRNLEVFNIRKRYLFEFSFSKRSECFVEHGYDSVGPESVI